MNKTGNVDEKLMNQKLNEVEPKFRPLNNILTKLHADLVQELNIKDNDIESFEKSIKFQIGNNKTNVLDHTNILVLDIIHSYSKALVFDETIKGMKDNESIEAENYWFEYHALYSIRQLSTLNDYIYQYINLFNHYNISEQPGFNRYVTKKAQSDNTPLYQALEIKDCILMKYRNIITHNRNPFRDEIVKTTQLDNGVTGIGRTEPTIYSRQQFIDEFESSIQKLVTKFEKVYKANK